MKTIYEVSGYNTRTIREFTCIRESKSTYWDDKGNQRRKNTSFSIHFETKEEAINYVTTMYENSVLRAKNELNNAEENLIKHKEQFKL